MRMLGHDIASVADVLLSVSASLELFEETQETAKMAARHPEIAARFQVDPAETHRQAREYVQAALERLDHLTEGIPAMRQSMQDLLALFGDDSPTDQGKDGA